MMAVLSYNNTVFLVSELVGLEVELVIFMASHGLFLLADTARNEGIPDTVLVRAIPVIPGELGSLSLGVSKP